MNWYNFIFSEKKSLRLRRHLVFWLLWWMYFTASYYHYEQSGLQKVEFEPWNFPFFIKINIAAFHSYNRLLLFYKLPDAKIPVQSKIYSTSNSYLLFWFLIILLSSYFIHKTVLPLINDAFNYKPVIANQNMWWTSITSGLLSAPKVISAAAAIKLLKRWWLKQKEKERLEKEKLYNRSAIVKSANAP